MFTAAKMVAALCIAALGYVASDTIRPLFPENTNFGMFNYVNTVVGFFCGWFVVGGRAGRGFAASISNGFTGAIALVLWGLFVQACNEMVARSIKRFYDSPFEAVAAIFEIGLEFGAKMLDPTVIVTLLVGGILAGMVTEIAAQRWR